MKTVFKTVLVALIFTFVVVNNVNAQSAFDDPGARRAGGSKTGDLTSVAASIDAGDVALGSSSQVVVLIRNDASKAIESGEISLYPSSNVSAVVEQNECVQSPLPPEAVCAIALSVKGLQPGKFRIEMLMRHSGRAKLLTTTISGLIDVSADGQGDIINDLETVPSEIKFGTLKESRPLTRSIILRNVTSKAIDISALEIESNESAGYALKSDCDILGSGQACIATITWAPQQRGPSTGVLVISHDGPTGVVSVVLDGTYEPGRASEVGIFPEAVPGKGLLTASQSDIDFGSNIESASSITVSLVNVGDEPIKLQNIRLSNDDSGISIANKGCAIGSILNPVEACPLTLTWEPVRKGSVLDDVQIMHDGARGILVLPIKGTASKAVNQDSGSIVFNNDAESILRALEPIPASSVGANDSNQQKSTPTVNVSTALKKGGSLEGYKITSLASNRAIVSGPGGSRVVFNGQETVIGGALWLVNIQSSAVKFKSGDQQILLLFDKSLAPFGATSTSTNNTVPAATVATDTVEN